MSKTQAPRAVILKNVASMRKVVFSSMKEMSGATGIPFDILRAAKDSGCPFITFDKADLFIFVEWFFGRDGQQASENWTTRDKRAAALIKEHKLMEARMEVVPNDMAQACVTDLIDRTFCGELERLLHELPATLKGKTEVEIALEVKRQIDNIRATYDERRNEWLQKMQVVYPQ